MYDLVFITHLPSFYKVRLYNELSRQKKIKVIFIGSSSKIRNENFIEQSEEFDYVFINEGTFEERSLLTSIFALLRVLLNTEYKQIIVGGWDLFEFWLVMLFSPKSKNSLIVESSIYECQIDGIKGGLKRLFLKKISKAYCCGTPHKQLLEALNFTGKIIITHGVGLIKRIKRDQTVKRAVFSGNLLYVGRLSQEKGLEQLIDIVNRRKDLSLAIVGSGPIETDLKLRAGDNIDFLGYVENEKIDSVMIQYDALILPSIREPWGLVVQEALACGLPVICSDRVGAAQNCVIDKNTGVTYNIDSASSFNNAINNLMSHYETIMNNVDLLDSEQINRQQVMSFL